MKDYVATFKSSQEPDTSLKLIKFSAFTKINWREINNVVDRLMNNLSKLQLLTSVRPACNTRIKTAQDFKGILFITYMDNMGNIPMSSGYVMYPASWSLVCLKFQDISWAVCYMYFSRNF